MANQWKNINIEKKNEKWKHAACNCCWIAKWGENDRQTCIMIMLATMVCVVLDRDSTRLNSCMIIVAKCHAIWPTVAKCQILHKTEEGSTFLNQIMSVKFFQWWNSLPGHFGYHVKRSIEDQTQLKITKNDVANFSWLSLGYCSWWINFKWNSHSGKGSVSLSTLINSNA